MTTTLETAFARLQRAGSEDSIATKKLIDAAEVFTAHLAERVYNSVSDPCSLILMANFRFEQCYQSIVLMWDDEERSETYTYSSGCVTRDGALTLAHYVSEPFNLFQSILSAIEGRALQSAALEAVLTDSRISNSVAQAKSTVDKLIKDTSIFVVLRAVADYAKGKQKEIESRTDLSQSLARQWQQLSSDVRQFVSVLSGGKA